MQTLKVHSGILVQYSFGPISSHGPLAIHFVGTQNQKKLFLYSSGTVLGSVLDKRTTLTWSFYIHLFVPLEQARGEKAKTVQGFSGENQHSISTRGVQYWQKKWYLNIFWDFDNNDN